MKKYYLGIDIGASSGRHMLSTLEDGDLKIEEIYRFQNGLTEVDGHLCWDVERLFREVKNGLKRCKELGKIPVSMGIDTWGVDFVLLDREDRLLGQAVAYRDDRTRGMMEALEALVPAPVLYEKSGIQPQSYNTIYQLLAVKKSEPRLLEQAEHFLMVAPYLHFLLTGNKLNEYTNVSTTGLMNCHTGDWDEDLLKTVGLSRAVMGRIAGPGTVVGEFSPAVQEELGYSCRVVLPPTHDTACAVLAVPFVEDTIYISSGTWSLMGVELNEADCSETSRLQGLTNEGSATGGICLMQNIMGLWIIQSIKKKLNDEFSFVELADMARKAGDFPSVIDVNDPSLMAPEDMIRAIQACCKKTGQKVPASLGEVMQCVYNSLAESYRKASLAIETAGGRTYSRIAIVGGGCQDQYLNELTAKATKKKVCAGPVEATAMGNILIQILADGAAENVAEAKKLLGSHSLGKV